MTKIYQRGDSLNASILDKLDEVFRELNWDIENKDRFNRFCEMLSRLKDEEQRLILELTRDFLHCGFTRYESTLQKVIPQLEAFITGQVKEIVVVPLISPKDVGKSKSSSLLVYPLYEALKPVAKTKNLRVSNVDRCSVLLERKARQNALIVFVDDFLGSGQTAQEALEEYNGKFKVESDTVVVTALVAQETAVTVLKGLGVEILYTHLRKRGITDSPRFPDKESALRLIDHIEERIKVGTKYRRGYQQSEALVCMLRCPNNTFPIFWTDKSVNGKPWPAPFLR